MKLSELKKIAEARTGGYASVTLCNVGEKCWCRVVSVNKKHEQIEKDWIVPDGAVNKSDAEFISSFANHADALLKVVEAAKNTVCYKLGSAISKLDKETQSHFQNEIILFKALKALEEI